MSLESFSNADTMPRERRVLRPRAPTGWLRWYAIHTKPKQEARVDANLRGWGLATLMPKVPTIPRARASQTKTGGCQPLFPGYLFACFDASMQLGKVRLTRGVHSVVGFGELATPIDGEIIAFVRSRLDDEGIIRPDALQPGDIVEIVDGPMRSMVGVFQQELRGQDRVVILLSAIGAQPRVNVSKDLVRKSVSPRTF
jgi:transcriptional antiterminator RfaH